MTTECGYTQETLTEAIRRIVGDRKYDALNGRGEITPAHEYACLTAFRLGMAGPEVDIVRKAYDDLVRYGLYRFDAQAPSAAP